MRALLDTNILIDYFDRREPFFQDAFKLRIMQEFGDIELWTAVNSFADIAYILRNLADSKTLQSAFLASLSFLHVCSLDQRDLAAACKEQWSDFEDCLINQCARKIEADFILTRDAAGFCSSSFTVLSPGEFFELISEQYGLSYDALGY